MNISIKTNKYKNIRTTGVFILLCMISLSACRKSDVGNAPGNNGKDWMKDLKELKIPSFTVNDTYKNISNLANALSRRKLNADEVVPIDNKTMGAYSKDEWRILPGISPEKMLILEQFESNVFVISPEMGASIYPGAILDAKSVTGDNFAPRPLLGIGDYMRPAVIKTSLPVSSGTVTKSILMKPSNGREFVNAALKDLAELAPGKIAPSRFQAEMSSFNTFDKLKTLYGYNKKLDLWAFDISTEKDVDRQTIRKRSGIIIKFFMENFSISVDEPIGQQLFDSTGMDKSLFMGSSPMYVSSVAYGRMGIMTIESGSDVSVLESAVRKKFSVLKGVVGGGTTLTQAETEAIDASIMRYAITGPKGSSTPIPISGIEAFGQIISENSSFTAETPGVPVSFKLKYLSSHKNVPALFEINYGELSKPYARIEYQNTKSFSGSTDIWKTADIAIVCYPTSDCIPGTAIRPANFISFQWQLVVEYNSGPRGRGNKTFGTPQPGTSRNKEGDDLFIIHPEIRYTEYRDYRDKTFDRYYKGYELLSTGKGYFTLPSKYGGQ